MQIETHGLSDNYGVIIIGDKGERLFVFWDDGYSHYFYPDIISYPPESIGPEVYRELKGVLLAHSNKVLDDKWQKNLTEDEEVKILSLVMELDIWRNMKKRTLSSEEMLRTLLKKTLREAADVSWNIAACKYGINLSSTVATSIEKMEKEILEHSLVERELMEKLRFRRDLHKGKIFDNISLPMWLFSPNLFGGV